MRGEDHLYVIGEGDGSGLVKIGRSSNVRSRLARLQTGNPRMLHVLHCESGAGHIEHWLHERLAGFRLRGEWFDFGTLDPVVTVRLLVEQYGEDGIAEALRTLNGMDTAKFAQLVQGAFGIELTGVLPELAV